VVLRVGGVYADVDTECRKPLSGLIRPHDTLVVSWESELGGADGAAGAQGGRGRQARPLQGAQRRARRHPGRARVWELGWRAWRVRTQRNLSTAG